ncbi:long-chain-fatty-acid--CoA ligase [Janthinobacterium lividum]|uniref:long-chain-fatty-acid--CoA ligase n=1 Tax=Janthinobacterium lividum TaxID=29581 RepID=UPI00044D6181|nr:long-chain-fatty-acid--CoA ligase [Janthinobacterium lividum]EZP36727.1 Long-chain-fatty-acid-CoA ligase protein [Janthinobacterium lividum]
MADVLENSDRGGFALRFTQGLHRAAQVYPGRTATVCNGRLQSYRQLAARVARLAAGLQAHGARRGTRIAMLGLNSDRYLEYYLAVPWAGGVVNPVNFRWSLAEIVHALKDSASEIVFVDDSFAAHVTALRDACPALRLAIFCGEGACPANCVAMEALIAAHAPAGDAGRGGDDTFGVFYTGGTTGQAKGVMLSHANVLNAAMGPMLEGLYRGHAVSLHAAPMFHLADLTNTAAQTLCGGTHVFLAHYRPDAVLPLIQEHAISDLLLVPAMLQSLVDHPHFAATDVSSVRNVVYGASSATEALIERVLKAFPGAAFYQVYGMTETAGTVTILPPEQHDPQRRKAGRLRSAGRSFCHTEVRIIGPEGGEAATGGIGEIVLRGPNIMQGYLNQEAATAATLRGGWMHTGDLGYMDDEGYVFIVDRLKDMILSGGENVYSNEVENAIASHPAVLSCAVIGIPSEQWGESVHAVVVLRPEQALTLADLDGHCRGLIASYKCPRSLALVPSLPMSGAGKLLKTELRKAFWEGRGRNVN